MRPWLKNILIVGGTLIIAFLLPSEVSKIFLSLIVFISTLWVYKDAKNLQIDKYKKTALSLSASPLGTAFLVLILWIIAFPMYISFRQKIIEGKISYH